MTATIGSSNDRTGAGPIDEASDGVHVVEAAPSDFRRIAACLARAFEDDPVAVYLFPDVRTRTRRLESLYRLVLAGMSAHGSVLMDRDGRGAAVWQAPSPPSPGVVGDAIGMLMLAAVMRSASVRAFQLNRAAARTHPRTPHWYLGLLGTEPAHQGTGIGSALLQPILARCDAANLPAYLESSKPANVAFYERHGFRVYERLEVEGGPQLWAMLRE